MTTLTDHEGTTTTTTTTEAGGDRTGRPERGNRTLKAIVIAMTVALVGLGAWVIIDRTSTPATAPSTDVAQVWDDYTDAWRNYDGDAFLDLTTDDYAFVSEMGTASAASQAAFINSSRAYDWQVTPVGERVMAGDGPWFVSQVHRIDDNRTGPVEGISVLTIVDDGGVLRVSNHTFFGDL